MEMQGRSEAQPDSKSFRQTHNPLELIRTAIGPREAVEEKIRRFAVTLGSWRNGRELARRVRALKDAGYVDRMPTPLQIVQGTIDNFRYFLIPGSRDMYDQLEIGFWFHQFLRWVEDPASMLDPTGLLSERDTIIGHLLQVVHHDPLYDLQLLVMFPDGLDALEKQTIEAIEGTTARAKTLRATIEEIPYYDELLEKIRQFRADPMVASLARPGFFRIENPRFLKAERLFSTVPRFMRYCSRLPDDPAGAARHLLFEQTLPERLAE